MGYLLLLPSEFFSHIEEEYDRVLGFKSKLDKLKSEIQEERSKRAAFQSQLAGIDWASFFRSFQGEQLLQGPTKEQKTTNKMQITEDVAESRSNLGSDVNTASIEDTLPTSGEIKKSSPEQSKSENENEPSDEHVRLYQENLRKKYGSPM